MSMLSDYHDIADEWDGIKNWLEHRHDPSWPDFPANVSVKYGGKAHWICPVGHRYTAIVYHRAINGTGCPYCSHMKNGSLQENYPEIAAEWDAVKNLGEHENNEKWPVNPRLVSPSSAKKAWWICSTCGHSWCYRIGHRTSGSNAGRCPVCCKNHHDGNARRHGGRRNRLIVGKTDLLTRIPRISEIWDYVENKKEHIVDDSFPAQPEDTLLNNPHKIYWHCKQCGMKWTSTIRRIIRTWDETDKNCPICPKCRYLRKLKHGVVSDYEEALVDWDYEKNLSMNRLDGDDHAPYSDPAMTPAAGSRRVWWICHRCSAEWYATPNSRCVAGRFCPVCSRADSMLIENNELMLDWDQKANDAAHESDSSWPNDPKMIARGSRHAVWWKCHSCGHRWKTSPNNRSNKSRTRGCPQCALLRRQAGHSLLEQEVMGMIVESFPDLPIVVRDREQLDGKELDLWFPSIQVAIEVNGDYYHNDFNGSTTRENAIIEKLSLCEDKGIVLGIVWESDWRRSQDAVIESIYRLISSHKVDDVLRKTSTCRSIAEYDTLRDSM